MGIEISHSLVEPRYSSTKKLFYIDFLGDVPDRIRKTTTKVRFVTKTLTLLASPYWALMRVGDDNDDRGNGGATSKRKFVGA